jgi:phosphoglycolate phosphatase
MNPPTNRATNRAFDLVMFDLDGTLIETAPEICDAVNDTLNHFDLPAVSQQQVNDWIGHGTRELLISALAFARQTDVTTVRASDSLGSTAANFDRHYQRLCGTRSHLYPQVRETLSELKKRGVRLAVVTNKEARYTATVLDAHRLSPLFDRVISGDTMPRKKPDPMGIQSCLNEFGTPANRALFVGDSSIDVATARNAGVRVWALPYGYNMGQPIARSEPDRLIADCSALLESL